MSEFSGKFPELGNSLANAAHNVERKNFDNFADEDVVCVSEMGSTGGKKNDSWILKNFTRNAHMSCKKKTEQKQKKIASNY